MKQSTNYLFKKWLFLLSLLFIISCQKETGSFKATEENTGVALALQSDAGTKYNTFKGPEIVVGLGYARSFATISHTGVPLEIGVMFTDEALSGLATVNTPYVLELHNKALESTLFQHIALGWSANGHPLPGSSMGPHFDVRFFMMSLADRLAIPAPPSAGFTTLPPTGYMPANYFSDVPGRQIGMHWTDKSFTAGVPVNHTMILGSYAGKFTFVSPIVVRTDLVNGQRFSIPYAQPLSFAVHGYYATKYNIYKDDKGNHYVSLSDFILR